MAIIEKAPAKINLGLDIVGRRSDGYHDLSMIMVSVDLNDYITVSEIDDNAIIVESNNHKMPLNDKNDVFKAAKLIREAYHISSGVKIELPSTNYGNSTYPNKKWSQSDLKSVQTCRIV